MFKSLSKKGQTGLPVKMMIFFFFLFPLSPPTSLPQAHTSPLRRLLVKITLQKLIHRFRVHMWTPLACFQETLSASQPPRQGLQVLWEKPGAWRGAGFQSWALPLVGCGDRSALLTAKPPLAHTIPQRICFSPPTIQFIVCKRLSLLSAVRLCPLGLFVSIMCVGIKYCAQAEV